MSDDGYYSDSQNGGNDSDEEETNVKSKSLGLKIKYNEDYDDADVDEDEEANEANEDDEDDAVLDDDNEQDDEDDDAFDEDDDEDEYNDDNNEEEREEQEGGAAKKAASKAKKQQVLINYNDDIDDDEDEYDENYLQKFDSEINKNYITEFHPECLSHNKDEVNKLAKVIRDENNNIIDPLHKTLPYLTKYEKARVLGQRAKQIEYGSKPLVKVPENIIDGYVIAELELREKKIPFIIKRPIPGGAFEYWRISDLENINF